jgi:tetratricopeptide (TPR) repeat protein
VKIARLSRSRIREMEERNEEFDLGLEIIMEELLRKSAESGKAQEEYLDEIGIKALLERSEEKSSDEMIEIVEKGESIDELIDLGDDLVKAIYEIALKLFDEEQYDQAGKVFNVLMNMRPNGRGIAFSLGMCLKAEEKWEEALEAFLVSMEV